MIYSGNNRFWSGARGRVGAQQTDQVCDPHSCRQTFAANITERQHEAVGRLFDTDEIARQVTHCKDLSRHLEGSMSHQTRRTQTTMHLRCFKDRSVQLSVISLQRLELLLRRRNCVWGSADVDCWESHDKTSSYKLVATTMNGKYETWFFGIWFELLSEMNDVRIDCPSCRIIFITPHGIEQSIATQCFDRIRDEVSEQSKFFCGKIDDVSIATHFVTAN